MGNSQTVDRKMLVAATTGSATYKRRALPSFVGGGTPVTVTVPFDHDQAAFTHIIHWATGVTSGTIVIEQSDSLDGSLTDTWAPIATVANNGGGTAYEDYVYSPGSAMCIRHRISVTVAGGGAPSVTTRIIGQPV